MKKNLFAKTMALVLTATVIVGGLTGCGSSSTSNSGNTGDNEGSGTKEMNVAMTTDIDSLDASRADDAQKGQIVLEVQETLLRMDEEGTAQPAGATSWENSEDGLVWTFHLRENKYSDGTDVVAADYVNGFLRTLDPAVGSHNAGTYYTIKGAEEYNSGSGSKEDVGVKAVDEHTLQITLKEPIPYFVQTVNAPCFTPIPEAQTQGDDNTTYGSDASKMIYSGPFKIVSWTRGGSILLEKNDNYWDAENVELDKVNFQLVAEENTRQQMFEQGKLDVIENINGDYYNRVESDISSDKYTLLESEKPRYSYICFNNQDNEGVFTNAKIRLAFSLAIDRDLYVSKVLKSDTEAYGIVPPAINNGDEKFRDGTEEPLKAVMSQDPKQLYEEGLKEIGMEGKELTITFLQGNANNDTKVKSEFFQNQWETKLGVKVKIDTASDSATFNQQVSKGLYQICNTGWGADYNDPMTFMQLYVTGDGNNAAFASNAKYDELVNACKSETDMSVRQEKFAEAEKIAIADEAFLAPLTFAVSQNLVYSNIEHLYVNGAGGPSLELRYVTFSN